MLSRIAESLCWLGRHTERADGTARILDTYLRLLNTGSRQADHAVVAALVKSIGLPAQDTEATEPLTLIRTLVFATDVPGSVAASLAAARENARGVRDLLPQTVWECLNVTRHELDHRSAAGPHSFLRWVTERCAMASGLVDQVMSHDESWQFVVLGRALERADLAVRLLTAVQPQAGPLSLWRPMVTACAGWEPYLRAHGSRLGPQTATDFLLLDHQFPRSVVRALATAEECLNQLEPPGSTRNPRSARWIVGRARTALDYRAGTDLSGDLPVVLADVQRSIAAAHNAVTGGFFRREEETTWATVEAFSEQA